MKALVISLAILALAAIPLVSFAQGGAEDDEAQNEIEKVETVWEVDPIVVTGTRTPKPLAETPVATELVTRTDLEKSGAESLSDFLENQAGVTISHSIFGSGVQLQGLSSEYVLVLVNGERAGGRKGGVLDLSRYNVENIERIEIVKGNQSALYGSDAIGGVINIITRASRSPIELEVHGNAGASGRMDFGGALGAKGDVWTSRVTTGWRKADPNDYEPEDPETSVDGYDEFSLSSHSEVKVGDWSKLEGRFSYLRRTTSGVDGGTDISATIFDRSNLTEMFTLSLSPNFWIGESGRLKGTAYISMYRDEYLQDQRTGDLLDTFTETWERLVQGTLQYDRYFGENHYVSMGVEGMHEDLETERLLGGQSDRQRLSMFFQDEWTFPSHLAITLLPGVRWDSDSQFGDHVTPKLALSHELGEKTMLRGSVGKGFRAPDFKELYVRFAHPAIGYEVVGNPDLEPEVSMSYSLSVERTFSKKLWASLSAFHHDFDNLIQGLITEEMNEGSGLLKATYFNVTHARIRGFETSLRYKLFKNLNVTLGYAFLDSRDEDTGNVLDGRPTHRGNVNLDYRLEGLKTNVVLRTSFVGERSFSEAYSGVESFKANPYSLMNLRISRDLGSLFKISMGVDNLLDEGDHDYLRIAPRRVFVGMGYQLSSSK